MRLRGLGLAAFMVAAMRCGHAQQWMAPTPEELAMKSEAGAPGAPAVYLYREEVTDDNTRTVDCYVRLKVLTEGGRQFANVELPYEADDNGFSIAKIAGRTIQPDGSVTSFSGKPYEKLLEKNGRHKVKAKIFTLPAVEVGSLLEYRYTMRANTMMEAPDWYPQNDLYLRRGHFEWKPETSGVRAASGQIALSSRLPQGVAVKVTRKDSFFRNDLKFDLDVENVPPKPHEPFMPPPVSVGYRVNFYYSDFKTEDEFWRETGKTWSTVWNAFAAPGPQVKSFAERTVLASDTPEQKLKKLYDAVMKLDNTSYRRTQSEREQQANGVKPALTSDDVLTQKHGSQGQLAALFVAMVRAAGFKAYVASVADRGERLFNAAYLSYAQFHGAIAIVELDGKEAFFDPGDQYTEFKHLNWWHALSGGIRQTDTGTALFATPGEVAGVARVDRVADLTMDERGEVSGTVRVSSAGDAAYTWRERALIADETSVNADLRSEMEGWLPRGMEVKVKEVQNLTDPDKPLVVSYEVKGGVGAATGKRMVVPAHLFQVNDTVVFAEEKRETAVLMPYASWYKDAIRLRHPKTMAVESMPKAEQTRLKGLLLYDTMERETPDSVISYREMIVAQNALPVEEYAGLRNFYKQVQAKDQEPMVLIRAAAGGGATSLDEKK